MQNDLLRKCGLLAHTSPAFLKNCWIKKLLFACGSWLAIMVLRKNGLSRPAKGGFTPDFAYQRAAIAPLPCLNLQLGFIKAANSELASFKKCNCNRKNRLQNQFASQMWATRPHLGSIFEKLLHRKTFQFACGSDFATALNQSQYSGNSPS